MRDGHHDRASWQVRAWLQGLPRLPLAWAATSSPRHWVLIRRSLTDPTELLEVSWHAPRPPGRSVMIWLQVRDIHIEHAPAGRGRSLDREGSLLPSPVA
jgi:hypothetical protein